MDTNKLISFYKKYQKNPHENLSELIQCIKNYCFDDIEKLIYSDEIKCDTNYEHDRILRSNTERTYPFYPFSAIGPIENLLRNQFDHKKSLSIFDLYHERDPIYIPEKKVIFGEDCLTNDFLEVIINTIENQTLVTSFASTLNQLANNIDIINKNNDKKIYLVNTDVPCFVNRTKLETYNTHLNDQMIDWKSGINFYTCIKNQKHFLPIFTVQEKNYKNILNLTQFISKKEDYIKIDPQRIMCECGSYRCKYEFIPHYKNFIDDFKYEDSLDIANNLKSQYRWFQVIQSNKKIYIYFEINKNHELKNDDVIFLEKTFNKPVFFKGKRFEIGRKIPAFWKVTPLMQ